MAHLAINPEFWRGKRVLVTGHTGFKGSWLCSWLAGMGATVTGFALPPATEPNLFTVLGLAERINSIYGDIRAPEAIARCMAQTQPEIVLHLAAQALVRYSYEAPVETYATNVMGTVHVLEAVRTTSSVRAIVSVTSDKCYENREWAWGYRESEAMGGYDAYSSSKGCAELVTAAYRTSYFNPAEHARHRVGLASARAGNVIGGGDWALDRLVPDIMRALTAGQPALIRNKHAIRPWQHVLEPLRGYLMLAERLYNGEISFAQGWNFGPRTEDAQPVEWIAGRLMDLWGAGASWLDAARPTPQPHEAHYLKLDCSLAAEVLGWQPWWTLEQALEKIVDWHRVWAKGGDIVAETERQIAAYAHCQPAARPVSSVSASLKSIESA
jgi:CDP-glucose 4,6-dehydratase